MRHSDQIYQNFLVSYFFSLVSSCDLQSSSLALPRRSSIAHVPVFHVLENTSAFPRPTERIGVLILDDDVGLERRIEGLKQCIELCVLPLT